MAQNRYTTGWLFIALVLSNHGIAMAARVEMDQQGIRAIGPDRAIARSYERFQQMSCDELAAEMESVTGDAAAWLQETSQFSDMNSQQIQRVTLFTIQISSIANVADMKLCLPEVLNSVESTAAHLQNFLSMEERFATEATSDASRERFQRAFNRVDAFESSLEDIQGGLINRHLLLPSNIEDPSVCPQPCTSCTREHNSRRQEAEEFQFKCIMDAGAEAPVGPGFTCEEPTIRNSNRNQQKSWCEVHDWEAAAAQTVDISAKAACGARSVLAPLQHGGDMSDMAISACEKELTGEALSQEEVNELRRLDSEIDDVVTPGNLAAFSLCLIINVITAVSELRLRSRTEESSLIETEQPAGVPATEANQRPFAYTQGSWRCRRSLLSLANGLFGGVIDIVIGIAYLALMGSLGILAAMSVFGADAVVATLGGSFGVATMGEAVRSVTTPLANRIANFLVGNDVVQTALTGSADAGAQAAGASADAAATIAEGVATAATDQLNTQAEAAGETLAVTIETMGGFGEQIMQYWPAVAGGLAVLSVGFGVWGFLKIWRSSSSPYDCGSGYVGHGPHAVCHPSLRYGEGTHAQCPGTTGTENEIAFICARENGGIMTFMGNCHFFDE